MLLPRIGPNHGIAKTFPAVEIVQGFLAEIGFELKLHDPIYPSRGIVGTTEWDITKLPRRAQTSLLGEVEIAAVPSHEGSAQLASRWFDFDELRLKRGDQDLGSVYFNEAHEEPTEKWAALRLGEVEIEGVKLSSLWMSFLQEEIRLLVRYPSDPRDYEMRVLRVEGGYILQSIADKEKAFSKEFFSRITHRAANRAIEEVLASQGVSPSLARSLTAVFWASVHHNERLRGFAEGAFRDQLERFADDVRDSLVELVRTALQRREVDRVLECAEDALLTRY